ncbi:MAG: HAMP domain-containing histidine kinase [Aeromicrobium sp.]|nr:HAMP domain-containing histidine kinase [Burkholderiales bacterium]
MIARLTSDTGSTVTLATDQNLSGHALSVASLALLAIRDEVFDVWEAQVRSKIEGANEIRTPIMINTLPAFYGNLAEALTRSYPRDDANSHNTSAAAHGGERARMTNLRPDQIIHEYQLFKETLENIVSLHGVDLDARHWSIIDTSINTAIRSAVREYTLVNDALRHKLAAALSHDMRSPLGVISNGAQLIEMAPDLPFAKRVAGKIQANAARLSEMIGEVLDALTAQPAGALPLKLTCFDMAELVQIIGLDFGGRVMPTVEVITTSVTGYWCYNTLRRAVENLVTNAANYGSGNVVRIHLAQTHGRLLLSVHNSGNPLQPEQLDSIFDYARRGNQTTVKGWGIGLPFVKRAAEDHGGSVTVDSSLATGTTFLIDVPVDCRPFVADSGPR